MCVGVLLLNSISRKERERDKIFGLKAELGMMGLTATRVSSGAMADESADGGSTECWRNTEVPAGATSGSHPVLWASSAHV